MFQQNISEKNCLQYLFEVLEYVLNKLQQMQKFMQNRSRLQKKNSIICISDVETKKDQKIPSMPQELIKINAATIPSIDLNSTTKISNKLKNFAKIYKSYDHHNKQQYYPPLIQLQQLKTSINEMQQNWKFSIHSFEEDLGQIILMFKNMILNN